jgi:signal transduction histidine kinase
MTLSGTRAQPESTPLSEALSVFDRGARLLEEAYRELWKTREAERAATELAASEKIRDFCHAIKNPLGGVRGLSALLLRELDTEAEKPRRLAKGILEGLDAIAAILDARAAVDEDRTDAGTIAEEAAGLALAADQSQGGNVRFGVDAPSGVELPVPASVFREILSNLLRNAAEACAGRGSVRVRIESSLDAVTTWIADDGCGLPRVDDSHLFRRGFSTKGAGRGRGLALVEELVRAHHGTIMFCRLSRGTLIRIRLSRRP